MKLAAIRICSDCPIKDCQHRVLCGKIPDECPLPEMKVCPRCLVYYRSSQSRFHRCPICFDKTEE